MLICFYLRMAINVIEDEGIEHAYAPEVLLAQTPR
jgi:hypothetical protein